MSQFESLDNASLKAVEFVPVLQSAVDDDSFTTDIVITKYSSNKPRQYNLYRLIYFNGNDQIVEAETAAQASAKNLSTADPTMGAKNDLIAIVNIHSSVPIYASSTLDKLFVKNLDK